MANTDLGKIFEERFSEAYEKFAKVDNFYLNDERALKVLGSNNPDKIAKEARNISNVMAKIFDQFATSVESEIREVRIKI